MLNVFFLTISFQDFTQQKYLASMEGAVLSGKLCAKQINDLSRQLKAEGMQEKEVTVKDVENILTAPALVVV